MTSQEPSDQALSFIGQHPALKRLHENFDALFTFVAVADIGNSISL